MPVYVAAGGPMVARYAGRVADGFICTSGKGRELYADQLVPAVDEGLDKAGRGHDEIDRMIEIKVSWDPDPEQALENTRFWAPLSLTAEQKHSIHGPAEMERAADELPIEQVAKRWVVASRPEEVVEALRVYTDLGFDHLVVHGPGHDQERFLSHLRRAGAARAARADPRLPVSAGEHVPADPGCPAAPGRAAPARPLLRRRRARRSWRSSTARPTRSGRATGTPTSPRRSRALDEAVDLGADIVDVGGVRAGQDGPGRHARAGGRAGRAVPRAGPRRHPDLVLSLDTWRSEVARVAAAEAGLDLVNDTWAGPRP